MGYIFEWDPKKAESNVRKHGVAFDEASTVFGDPLALLMPDPDHSLGEERYLVLGTSSQQRLWWWPLLSGLRAHAQSQHGGPQEANGGAMKKKDNRRSRNIDHDTMRPQYDFAGAARGITAARYAQGANIAVIDPEVLDVSPDEASVNQALRALAPVLRRKHRSVRKRRGA